VTVVYIDKVFLLNLSINYLLLLGTSRLAGVPLRRIRLGLSAAFGAAYAVAAVLPGWSIVSHPVCRLAAGLIMALIAYWQLRGIWYLTILFFLLSGMLGGILLVIGLTLGQTDLLIQRVYCAQIDGKLLIVITVGLYFLLYLLFSQGARHRGRELMHITISLQGRKIEVLALHDTGNTLRDPIGGQPILVIESAVLEELWAGEVRSILKKAATPESALAQLHRQGLGLGFTLLPYHSVTTTSGLLLAVRSDYIKVGKATYSRAWIALVNHSLSDGGPYHALWGGVKKGENYAAVSVASVVQDPSTQQAG